MEYKSRDVSRSRSLALPGMRMPRSGHFEFPACMRAAEVLPRLAG
jgi:hypothetical protein